ncbi:MAG TPA: DedA family protein [Candidatus Saccharimonadales bacterium]|nr:DedA family protein [Candidatus Saccharimonadales bacterium]
MFDVAQIVQAGGLALIAAIVFAEVGLMVGFFLPGDTLLLTAGVFAGQGKLPLAGTIIVIALAAMAGDNTAYLIGHKLGRRLFRKPNGLIFRQEYIVKAEKFYEIYGSKTALIAHFLPIIRTFSPLLSGVAKMPYAKFTLFDAIGDIAWALSITLLGYFVGTRIPNINHYIMLFLAVVVTASFGPTLYHLIKAFRERHRTSQGSD